MAYEIKDRNFNCDKLTIFTCETEGSEVDLRKYVVKNWEAIAKRLDNSTILFLCGVHGGKDGTLGDERKIQYLKAQVIF